MEAFNDHPLVIIVSTIFISILILGAVVVYFLGRLRKARPTPTEFEQAIERMSNDMLDQMNTEISVVMDRFRSKVEDLSTIVNLKLEGYFATNLLCSSCVLAKENLIGGILNPLSKAGVKNNFSVVLSKQMFGQYREDLISRIKDRHAQLQQQVKQIRCTVTEYFPDITEITVTAEEVADFWLYKVLLEYTEAVKGCLEVCYKFKQKFIADEYRVSRIDVRIGKYQDTLGNLERRFTSGKVAIERRAS